MNSDYDDSDIEAYLFDDGSGPVTESDGNEDDGVAGAGAGPGAGAGGDISQLRSSLEDTNENCL